MAAILVLENVIKEIVEYLEKGEEAVGAYIFGSMARGDYHLDSDIDILVVGKKNKEAQQKLAELASSLTEKYRVPVSVIFMDLEEWRNDANPIVRTVKREGKKIWMRRQS